MASIQKAKPEEESVDEDIKMENVRGLYDLYIQNSLQRTSHSLEWLPQSHQDQEHPEFDFNYFLMGTHLGEEGPATENLQLVRVRVPNRGLDEGQIGSLTKFQTDLSRLEIVCEFEHQEEVIKARSMP